MLTLLAISIIALAVEGLQFPNPSSVLNPNSLTVSSSVTITGNQTLYYGVQFLTNYSIRPTCSSTTRGWVWFSQGGVGVKDTIDVCEKSALDLYTWIGIG